MLNIYYYSANKFLYFYSLVASRATKAQKYIGSWGVVPIHKEDENMVNQESLLSMSALASLGKVPLLHTINGSSEATTTTLFQHWENQRVVLVFLRRFQCPYCKMAAAEVSKIRADLNERNVRLVGVGTGLSGLEEFKVKLR